MFDFKNGLFSKDEINSFVNTVVFIDSPGGGFIIGFLYFVI